MLFEIEDIARVAHQANQALRLAIGETPDESWDEAPDWQRESVIAGVRQILSGEVTTPEESHARWLARKREEGWSYGPVKDPKRKIHPCFCEYDALPPEQRVKDHLFFAIVATLAPEATRAGGAPS